MQSELLAIQISGYPHYDVRMASVTKMQKKGMKSPDETRSFEKGKVEIAKIGEISIGIAYFEPGWSWEN
jgi:hypothetical protein